MPDLCDRYVILLVTCQEMFWDWLCLKYFITAGGHITLQFCSEICTVSEADLPMVIWCQTFFSSVLRLLFPNNCASSAPFLKRGVCSHSPLPLHPPTLPETLERVSIFIMYYLATLNLKSSWWHVRSSFLTRDWTQAPCIGSTAPWPQDHQRSPYPSILPWKILNTSKLQEFYSKYPYIHCLDSVFIVGCICFIPYLPISSSFYPSINPFYFSDVFQSKLQISVHYDLNTSVYISLEFNICLQFSFAVEFMYGEVYAFWRRSTLGFLWKEWC